MVAIFGVGPEAQFHGGVADNFVASESGEAKEIIVHFEEAAVCDGGDGDGVWAETKRFGEFFFGDEQFFFGEFAAGDVADGETQRVLVVVGGRDAVHAREKPALAGRDVEGILEFFAATGDENSVKNQGKRAEEIFADNVGDAFTFQFVAGAIEKLVVGGPDVEEGAVAREFEHDFVNRTDEGFEARFIFSGAGAFGRFRGRAGGGGGGFCSAGVLRIRNAFHGAPKVTHHNGKI